jgi:hypothetical protein
MLAINVPAGTAVFDPYMYIPLYKPVIDCVVVTLPTLGVNTKPFVTTPVMTEQAKVNALKKFLKRSV